MRHVQVRSSAPTRIDLAGGTLDIWPLYLFHPLAQTVNVAIGLRATCTISTSDDGRITILSQDTGRTISASNWRELPTEGDNQLLAHIARFFEVDSLQIITEAQSPLGAGIAGSSALNIAVCGGLARWCGIRYSPDQLVTLAMNLEARTLGIPTGVQDYYPALHGGVSALELGPLGIHRAPLDVDPAELDRRIVLAYSGDSRSSGINNWEITRRHIEGDETVKAPLQRIAEIAAAARAALTAGAWQELARQLSLEWDERQALAPGMTTPAIDRLISRAVSAGALAAKVCGAGGGGCVVFLVNPDHQSAVRDAVISAGGRLLDSSIDTEGLRVDGIA